MLATISSGKLKNQVGKLSLCLLLSLPFPLSPLPDPLPFPLGCVSLCVHVCVCVCVCVKVCICPCRDQRWTSSVFPPQSLCIWMFSCILFPIYLELTHSPKLSGQWPICPCLSSWNCNKMPTCKSPFVLCPLSTELMFSLQTLNWMNHLSSLIKFPLFS